MPMLQPGRQNLMGFDCNAALSTASAKALFDAGYRFAVRYVPRVAPGHAYDISAPERDIIHNAGLALMIVQHVESAEAWDPTEDKGAAYGYMAAESARKAGYLAGATLWCDLEGVRYDGEKVKNKSEVIAFLRNWHKAVTAAGYKPGLYVGWHNGLTPNELWVLPFDRYWSAYNLNADQFPMKRGVCLYQHLEQKVGGVTIDPDIMKADALGGFPVLDAPDEWAVR